VTTGELSAFVFNNGSMQFHQLRTIGEFGKSAAQLLSPNFFTANNLSVSSSKRID